MPRLSRRIRRGKTRRKRLIGGNTQQLPSSFQNYVQHIVYINLERRKNRRTHITSQLSNFDSSRIHRVPAVEEPNHPALGCTKSHLKAMQMARDNKWDNVLILEDDAVLANLDSAYPVFEKLINNPYDVIMLGGTMAEYDKQTYRVKKSQAGSSYLVHHSYYDTLIKETEKILTEFDPKVNDARKVAVDLAVFKPLQARDKWFIVKPSLFVQRKDYSNIEHRHVNYNKLFNESSPT